MKYYYKIYNWQDGKKSTDYTPWTTAPIFIEDKLDETLDTAKLTLECVPTTPSPDCPVGSTPFAPKTKFRIERYLQDPDGVGGDVQKTWDYVVDHDDVECLPTLPQYCTHHLYLIEASVIAQGMHVDNIALTYELQDVTLNYRTVNDSTDQILDGVIATPGGYMYGT